MKLMLCVELNSGQMIEDVRLGVNGKVPVEFYGRQGGMMPTPESIVDHLQTLIQYRNVN
jgi:2-oxoglutarate ferredoxin oxidoreductase subunit alpha